MSPKELLYIEDALGHEQFCITQCQNAAQNLQDTELKSYVQQLEDRHRRIYGKLFQLI